jgi:hypothetical protein
MFTAQQKFEQQRPSQSTSEIVSEAFNVEAELA